MPEPVAETVQAAVDPRLPLQGSEAVLTHYPGRDADRIIASEAFLHAKWDRGELTIEVRPQFILDACRLFQADGFNFLEDVTAVDWYPTEPRFQVSYALLSHRLRCRLRVVVRLVGDAPAIDSITPVWPSANFYEREVYDLFGIDFPGHPRLTRIMMPDNWKGHPLRKDYPVEGYR